VSAGNVPHTHAEVQKGFPRLDRTFKYEGPPIGAYMNDTRRSILDALSDGPVRGPDLAERLDVSRAAVWKHVDALREAGFGVESDAEGYHVTDVPPYGGPAIAYGFDAPYDVEYHERVGSTNDRARELAGEGAPETVVVADEQTGGRGRLDREWDAPSGGVYLSPLLRPSLPPARAPLLTMAAAVATTEAVREAGVDARIKWPNDVLVEADGETRKLAGILTEMEGEADRVSWVVVGVGVNANVDPSALPPGATSVREQRSNTGHDPADVDRRRFVQRLVERFHDYREDPESVLPAWRDLAATLGERVRVETPTRTVVGTAVDVEPPGTLLIETEDGTTRVSAGDCEHLRPAA
jgi:BirA family biotin operon repressor/biotin-[acetyl-CoA-carboxylase] ligase